jgi:hypothetical protein
MLVHRSLKVAETFYKTSEKCLTMAVPQGRLDCKFWLSDGLNEDAKEARLMENKAFRSSVTSTQSDWTVETSKMPEAGKMHTTEYSEVIYTLWVRFMQVR